MAEKRCHYCGTLFVPDPRVGNRQRACCLACQRLRKREHNRFYRMGHPECWENHYRDYVKPWRQRHPDYQRQWRQRRKAQKKLIPSEIQAERLKKAIEFTEKVHLFLREIQAEIRFKGLAIAMRKAPLILKVH